MNVDNELRVGRRFEHYAITTGYTRPDGTPEPAIYEITQISAEGMVFYGPAQRGRRAEATLCIWESSFFRDALGEWVD